MLQDRGIITIFFKKTKNMEPKRTERDLLKLYNQFYKSLKTGKRLQRNGKRVKQGTLENYKCLHKLLFDFSISKSVPLVMRSAIRMSPSEVRKERKYWKGFYMEFANYLYEDLDCYDNYVGQVAKMLRVFFNYLVEEKGMVAALFHRVFYAPTEEIQIVVLSPERLNFLINNLDFEKGCRSVCRK
jgi:hypothetical protein